MKLKIYLFTVMVATFMSSCNPEKEGLPQLQLYDLSNDIGETNNVYQEHPEVVEKLLNLLKKYKNEERSVPLK